MGLGPIVRHGIFDVPKSYGDKVAYFKKLSKEKVLDLFNKFKDFNSKSE